MNAPRTTKVAHASLLLVPVTASNSYQPLSLPSILRIYVLSPRRLALSWEQLRPRIDHAMLMNIERRVLMPHF